MKNVACVGVGTIGKAWAIAFARGGCNVRIFDHSTAVIEAALSTCERNLADLEEFGLVQDHKDILSRITPVEKLGDALEGAFYVQESTREELDAKKQIFSELTGLANPETILASSTSALLCTDFASDIPHAGRCIVAHPFNPPYLIPVVEICGGAQTSHKTVERTRAFLESVAMSPIVLNKEINGFLLNRIQAAVVIEALHLVGEGYCTPEDFDRAMTNGLSMRWSFMGPFMTGHLNSTEGYHDYMTKFDHTYRELAKDLRVNYAWNNDLLRVISQSMASLLSNATIYEAQAWRDRRLMAHLLNRKNGEPIGAGATD